MHWFVSSQSDTRSSLYRPLYHSFRGAKKWNQPDRREEARAAKDLKNASLVLLTRARQGMVIFVPHV